MTVPQVQLLDGTSIPQLGFGVFQVPPSETERTVLAAFEAGYRHIDTAQMYDNEAGVGAAIKASGIPREELYITSKLSNAFHRPDDARRSLDESLVKLGLETVDLFLIHWPLPTLYDGDYVSTWATLTEFVEDGRVTSAGVSNFEPDHLHRIVQETSLAPVVNQIEVNPYFTNVRARAATLEHGAKVEAWSPIARGAVVNDATIADIALDQGKTASQVALRWHIDQGHIIFPKTMSAERMRENFDIFDFSLTPEQVERIASLDRGKDGRTGPDPNTFARLPG